MIRRFLFAAAWLLCLTAAALPFWQSRDSNYNAAISGGGGGGPTTCAALIAAVSNVKACFDASTGVTTSGSNVTDWADQSANAFHLALNASSGIGAPTSPVLSATSYNSLPGITFTAASSEYLATTSTGFSLGGTAATFCMATTLNSAAASFARAIVFASGAGSDFNTVGNIVAIDRNSTLQALEWAYNNGSGTAYSITYATPMRVCHVFDGANASTYLNNALQHTDALSPSFSATGQLVVAADYGTGGGSFWDGTVRRIVILSAAASSTDRSNIDTFLQN